MPLTEFSLFRGSMLRGEDTLARHNPARSRYHRVIADAVAALEPNTVETRLALYARARKAFVTSLGHCDPPLAEAEFELERLAFEQVINHVEAQTTRQQRVRRPPTPKERRRKHRPAPRWRTKIANIAAGLNNLVRNKSTAVLSLLGAAAGWLEERRQMLLSHRQARSLALGDDMPAQKVQKDEPLGASLFEASTDQVHEAPSEIDPEFNRRAAAACLGFPLAGDDPGGALSRRRTRPERIQTNPRRGGAAAAALSQWAQNAGMWSRAVRIRWRHLLRFKDTGPVVLLFKDGSAGLLTGANASADGRLSQESLCAGRCGAVAIDELRLSQVWAGEAVLLRASRGHVAADALFNLRWLVDLVLQERRSLRDIGLASLTISFLTDIPAALGHDDGQQGAAVPQRLDAGAALGHDGGRLRL